jgi:hypothetical protein
MIEWKAEGIGQMDDPVSAHIPASYAAAKNNARNLRRGTGWATWAHLVLPGARAQMSSLCCDAAAYGGIRTQVQYQDRIA